VELYTNVAFPPQTRPSNPSWRDGGGNRQSRRNALRKQYGNCADSTGLGAGEVVG